jgi:4-carboxymuconolactone decarboxylase
MDKGERKKELLEKYNRKGVETGIDLQGEFFLTMLHFMDEVDPEWAEVWLTWIYDHMYNRGVLDHKTRVLVIIGECVVAGHGDQLRNHMRTALTKGATPEEIREVVLQASIYAGMPAMIRALRTYRDLMKDLGLLEMTDSPFDQSALDPR